MDKVERRDPLQPHVHVDARHLSAPLLQLDLAEELRQVRHELRAGTAGHVAKTLSKYDDLRTVLIAFEPGGCLDRHQTQGRVCIHVLEGSVAVRIGEQAFVLGRGGLLHVGPHVAHEVEAMEPSALLVTIAWPGASAVHAG